MPDISLETAKTILLNGGSFAVLVWLVIYAVRVMFPTMQKSHADALTQQADTFKLTLDNLRADWIAERERHEQALQSLVASVDKLSDKVDRLSSH